MLKNVTLTEGLLQRMADELTAESQVRCGDPPIQRLIHPDEVFMQRRAIRAIQLTIERQEKESC